MDVLKPTSGQFQFFGQSTGCGNQTADRDITPNTVNFYHYLSGEQNLRIAAEIKQRGHELIDDVPKKVNLYERKKSKFSTYTLGMKQRLVIASSMLGNPNVLVFDEPTNGLDPVGIAEIRDLIKGYRLRAKPAGGNLLYVDSLVNYFFTTCVAGKLLCCIFQIETIAL